MSKNMHEKANSYTVLKYFVMQITLAFALVMIDAPLWLILLVTPLVYLPLLSKSIFLVLGVCTVYSLVKLPLYIWAFIVTVQGDQDVFAIIFYIVAVIQLFSMIKDFFTYLVFLFNAIFRR